MGLILRTERRPIEAVYGQNLISLKPGQKYFLEGKELFFIGVSKGVGTCSDLRGIDIAVFQYTTNQPAVTPSRACHGTVLIRNRREGELTKWLYPEQIKICLVAEGIEIARSEENTTYFESNHKTEIYVPLE